MHSTLVCETMLGNKTETRRVIAATKKHPEVEPDGIYDVRPGDIELKRSPYGGVGGSSMGKGDMETKGCGRFVYEADKYMPGYQHQKRDELIKWRPSIFMPRWASRLTLEILSISVERLQKIKNKDAVAEGVNAYYGDINAQPRLKFQMLWDGINKDRGYSWDENPWVYVIKYKPHMGNIDKVLEKSGREFNTNLKG